MARRDYGTGSITARGPNRWQLRWMDPPDPITGNRPRRASTFHGTKRDASARLALLSAGNRPVDTAAVTLGQTIDMWRTEAKHELSTARNYDLARRTLTGRTLDLPLAELNVRNLRIIVDHTAATHGPHRGRLVHALVSGALRYAFEQHWITENLMDRIRRPTAKKGEHVEPTSTQLRELIALVAQDPQLVAWLELHGDTGARRQEVLALRWRNVRAWTTDDDRLEGEVFIEHAVDPIDHHIKATKTGNTRTVSIAPRTCAVLAVWRDAMEERATAAGTRLHPDAFVLSDALNGIKVWRPDLATKRFGKLRKKVGLEQVRLTDLRHYVATQLLAAGYDPKNVAARLGHTRVQTTEDIYANRLPARDRAMAEHLQTLG